MHEFWSLTPGVGVALYAAWRASGRRAAATAGVIGVLMLPLARSELRRAQDKIAQPYTQLTGLPVLEGMRVPTMAQEADRWQELVDVVHAQLLARPDAPMLVEGRDALVAALVTNHRNPGPFYVDWEEMGLDLGPARARFIATQHPLVFVQRPVSPPVARMMAIFRYRPVLQSRLGTLVVWAR